MALFDGTHRRITAKNSYTELSNEEVSWSLRRSTLLLFLFLALFILAALSTIGLHGRADVIGMLPITFTLIFSLITLIMMVTVIRYCFEKIKRGMSLSTQSIALFICCLLVVTPIITTVIFAQIYVRTSVELYSPEQVTELVDEAYVGCYRVKNNLGLPPGEVRCQNMPMNTMFETMVDTARR